MRHLVAIALLLLLGSSARAEVGWVQPPELAPSVHHGHSVMWKTGAIITAASVGVTLLGAALTVEGVSRGAFGACDITEGEQCPANATGAALFEAGLVISIAGDGGLFFGGPATWIAGARTPSVGGRRVLWSE